MADGQVLGEFEQLVLLGVLQCGAEAYAVPISRELETRARRGVSLGAVYKTLDRLEAKGYLASSVGEPTAARGGRSTRVYKVTPLGLRQLRSALASIHRMSDGLRELQEPR